MFPMSTDTPKPTAPRVTGLGPKAQKLAALRAKLDAQKNGGDKQNFSHGTAGGGKAASAGFKKTNFQRKAT